MMPPWMIWDLERQREKQEREAEVGRGLYAPPPLPPGWEPERKKPEEGEWR